MRSDPIVDADSRASVERCITTRSPASEPTRPRSTGRRRWRRSTPTCWTCSSSRRSWTRSSGVKIRARDAEELGTVEDSIQFVLARLA
jgi:hypothetical protein